MNFNPDLLAKVLDGTKTQTRRLKKPGEGYTFAEDGMTIIVVYDCAKRVKWKVGNTYAVAPGRGKAGVARIRILKIQISCAWLISDDAAVAEGFADRQEFLDRWAVINGKGKEYLPCWALTFECVKPLSQEYLENKLKDLDPIQYKRLMYGEWIQGDK